MDNTDFQAQWRGAAVERYAEAVLREAAGLEPGRLAPKHRSALQVVERQDRLPPLLLACMTLACRIAGGPPTVAGPN